MQSLSMALNDFYSLHADYTTRLVLHPVNSNGTIVDAAAAATHLLRDLKVDAIIGPQTSTQAIFVMDLGERAHVSILSFSATSPSLIHRTPYFVQTAQSDANQVHAIASIVKKFRWTQVVIICEDTEFGNSIISYLSNALQDVQARVPYTSLLPTSATDDDLSDELRKMMNMQTRVFVVHTSQFLAARLFLKARDVGMMSEGFAWIITSGLTDLFSSFGSDVAEAMEGVLGVRPLIPKSKRLDSFASRWRMVMKVGEVSIFGVWAYDTLWALGLAAERVGNSNKTVPELLKALLSTRFKGLAGEFNLVGGQLVPTSYEVVNVVGGIERPVGIWTPSDGTTPFSSTKKSIIWPGDSTVAPRGWVHHIIGKKLRIAVPEKPGFNNFLRMEKKAFKAVMEALQLPFEFHPYPFFNSSGSRVGSYDDLVHQVYLQKEYDGGIGDITITANRSNYVDFTMPYAEGGIACMVLKYEDVNDAFIFLQLLTTRLYITTLALYLATAVVTTFLAWKLDRSSRDWLAQRAGMASPFPFFPGDYILLSLSHHCNFFQLNQPPVIYSLICMHPGEGIHVIMIIVILVSWNLVANLVMSTYTASLSSKLTAASLLPIVKDVNQLKVKGDSVGCQDGSFLESYLLKTRFHSSRIKRYTTENDSIQALINGNISAYCDVLPHIRVMLRDTCGKFMMIDPVHRTDGFAFVFPRGFPATADISRAIIQLTENNSSIFEIEQQPRIKCGVPDDSNKVSLRSFSVLFSISGFVTLACFIVSLLNHLHSKRPLPQRISDFNARIRQKYLHPAGPLLFQQLQILRVETETPQVEEIYSNESHFADSSPSSVELIVQERFEINNSESQQDSQKH